MSGNRVRFLVFLPFAAAFFSSLVAITSRPLTAVSAHADKKATGAELFAASGCTHCHGKALQGTDDGPPLQDVRKRLSSKQIYKQIRDGGQTMPAFGPSLDGEQIKELIAFLKAKDRPALPQ